MDKKHHAPLQQRIHGDICHEVNEIVICLKLHQINLEDKTNEQTAKINYARNRHPKPTDGEIIDLFQRCHTEMSKCTKPFRKY